jgi:DNA-binding CsgD family transcriptional regulator
LLRKHGLKHCLCVGISPEPGVKVSIAVQRSLAKASYTDDDRDCLARLSRHPENSLRLSVRLLDAELSSLGLREALSRLRIGVFALDRLGRVVFSNPAGEGLVGDGLSVVDRHLTVSRSASRNEFEAAIARMLRGEPEDWTAESRPILIDRTEAARPLTVYILPAGSAYSAVHEFLANVRILVLAIDPKTDAPPDPTIVRDLLGLTLAEARVASLVGSGLSPRETADKLGIAEETARTALKRVFSKVGISRQSELAAMLTKLVLR